MTLTSNYDVFGGNLAQPPSYLYVPAKFPTREKDFESPGPASARRPMVGAD
ncbi:MAG: hypothetical protein LBT47_07240 [Deltaproteobacteria bacterium]|nr:hypothetical protein [Deltaproteobacteria bacterium]